MNACALERRDQCAPVISAKVFRAANLTLCATALSFEQGHCDESVLFLVARMFAAVDSALVGADDELGSVMTASQLAARLSAAEESLRAAARAFREVERGAASALRAAASVYAETWDLMRQARERVGARHG